MTYEQAAHLFDDPSDVPFEVRDLSSASEQEGYTIHDIIYTAHDPQYGFVKGWTPAYLVRPAGDGPFAGILFLHWLGDASSNREEFLEEAELLAKQGVVSLLIDGYFPWGVRPRDGESDRLQVIHQVIELRRAVDFLLSQPGVDPQRIAYVGHDYGAIHGGVLSGVEKRVKAYVLMAGMGTYSDWSLDYFLGSDVDGEAYREALAVVDPIQYVPHAAPASLLFQFSSNDGFVPQEVALDFFNAASEPKEVKWYNTSHRLDEVSQRDRLEWLANQLDLPPGP
ncbi:MAG TPA: hypothetical protein VIK33_02870 [Anaerolineae bacterium]